MNLKFLQSIGTGVLDSFLIATVITGTAILGFTTSPIQAKAAGEYIITSPSQGQVISEPNPVNLSVGAGTLDMTGVTKVEYIRTRGVKIICQSTTAPFNCQINSSNPDYYFSNGVVYIYPGAELETPFIARVYKGVDFKDTEVSTYKIKRTSDWYINTATVSLSTPSPVNNPTGLKLNVNFPEPGWPGDVIFAQYYLNGSFYTQKNITTKESASISLSDLDAGNYTAVVRLSNIATSKDIIFNFQITGTTKPTQSNWERVGDATTKTQIAQIEYNGNLSQAIAGTDNRLYTRYLNLTNNQYSPWERAGDITLAPGSDVELQSFNNKLYLFAVGFDTKLYYKTYTATGGWTGWKLAWGINLSTTSYFNQAVKTLVHNNQMYLAGVGFDNKLYTTVIRPDETTTGWNSRWRYSGNFIRDISKIDMFVSGSKVYAGMATFRALDFFEITNGFGSTPLISLPDAEWSNEFQVTTYENCQTANIDTYSSGYIGASNTKLEAFPCFIVMYTNNIYYQDTYNQPKYFTFAYYPTFGGSQFINTSGRKDQAIDNIGNRYVNGLASVKAGNTNIMPISYYDPTTNNSVNSYAYKMQIYYANDNAFPKKLLLNDTITLSAFGDGYDAVRMTVIGKKVYVTVVGSDNKVWTKSLTVV